MWGSGHHFGPQETGQFSGHRGGDHRFGVLSRLQVPEASGQAELGRPGPGQGGGGGAFLAAAQGDTDPGVVLVGPGRLDQLGAQMGVAGPSEPTSSDGGAAGVFGGHQAGEPGEVLGSGKAPKVAHLAGDGERPQPTTPR
jgi:hypothetical protein